MVAWMKISLGAFLFTVISVTASLDFFFSCLGTE